MPRDELLQVRRDSTANWDAVNPVLASGEPGWDITRSHLKIGDGATAWRDLPTYGLPGLLLLEHGAPVPDDTPPETVVFEKGL